MVIRYACKDFRRHMNINEKMTIRGMIRKYRRKYPGFFGGVEKIIGVGCVYVLLFALVPGS